MKIFGSLILMLSLFALAVNPALAAPKMGYFDLQVVLQTSNWGKQSNDQFKVQGEKIKQDVDEKARAFKTAREEFEKKREVMDEKARNKRLQELQTMQNEGEKLIMESNAKLSKLSQELSAPLVEKIIEIVKRIGKDDKFDYVFERDKGGIVFANDKEDLTERIISELNKVTPKK
jgi:outer membrane protein